MFTPKIEGLQEITVPHFSTKIVHNPKIELSSLPHSIKHLSDEELFKQIQELTDDPTLIRFEEIGILRTYGILWIDDSSYRSIVLKSRKDVWVEECVDRIIESLADGYYQDWLDKALPQDQKERGLAIAINLSPNWDECRNFVNENQDVIEKYLMDIMSWDELLGNIGKKISSVTNNLYLIEDY